MSKNEEKKHRIIYSSNHEMCNVYRDIKKENKA